MKNYLQILAGITIACTLLNASCDSTTPTEPTQPEVVRILDKSAYYSQVPHCDLYALQVDMNANGSYNDAGDKIYIPTNPRATWRLETMVTHINMEVLEGQVGSCPDMSGENRPRNYTKVSLF